MLEINLPDVVAEVTSAFPHYERALVTNDVAALDLVLLEEPLHTPLWYRAKSLRI